MRILITGCSGYIGSHLTPKLKHHGHWLLGVDRDGDMPYSQLDKHVHGNLLDSAAMERTFSENKPDLVIHLAAARADWGLSDCDYFKDNLDATRALLTAGISAGIKDWIFYSSVSTMGPSDVPIDESAGFSPIDAYGKSKAEAEKLFHSVASERRELRFTIIRPSVVYGPGNPPDTNIHRLIDAIRRRRFVMVGPGNAMKSMSYMDNLISATMFLMDYMEAGVRTYTYVDEPVLSTRDIVARLYSLIGKKQSAYRVPLGVAKPIAYISDLAALATGIDFPITAARIEKFNRSTNYAATAIRKLGFKQPVSNNEALRKTVEWQIRAAV